MGVVWHFQVSVRDSDYRSAREALNLNADEDQPVEIPESVSVVGDPGQVDEEGGSSSYLEQWDPNQATEEIWSQGLSDSSSIVELSLKENLIRFRMRSENGTR